MEKYKWCDFHTRDLIHTTSNSIYLRVSVNFMNKTQTLIEAGKILSADGLPQNICVLDLGCGPALYWKEAIPHFKISMITGVDFLSDQDMRFQEQGNSFHQTITAINSKCDNSFSDFDFVQSDILSFTRSTTRTYDLIVCFQILSLINKSNAKLLLLNFKSILNTFGLIAFCIPNDNFILMQKNDWPPGIPDYARNKYNLSIDEFKNFVQEYSIKYYVEKDTYHWAIISCA